MEPTEGVSYEEQFGRLARLARRAGRRFSWAVKGVFGLRRTFLVETRWRLGDEIMALPIYESLRRRYPGSAVFSWCHYPELLEGNPYVSGVNVTPVSVDRYLLLRGAPRDVYRMAHYASCAGVSVPEVLPEIYYRTWETPLLEGLPARFVAVCPGASWGTKRWPLERWRALCRALNDAGYPIVELGRRDESIGVGVSLMDRTSVREAARVLHAARLVVSCDSGLMHLGLAAGAPVMALFGPTDPSILIRNHPRFRAITSSVSCRGCWNDARVEGVSPGTCPSGKSECMAGISVERVLDCVVEWLETDGPGG